MVKPVEIVVGRGGPLDPVAGTTVCPMPSYAGQDFWLEKTGYGPYDYDKYQPYPGGGFLLIGGAAFQANERFYVHFTGLSYNATTTSYSNGFNFSKVVSALYGRVNWKQPAGVSAPVLTSVNTNSRSGRYFQDFHTLATVANVSALMEQVGANDNDLNAYLEQLQRAIILTCLAGVFNEPEYISKKLLFARHWSANDQLVVNQGAFVGIRLQLPPTADISVQIDSVALYFNADVSFNLYVFSEVKKAPIAIIEVSAEADSQTVVNLPDLVLNYISNTFGGTYYIGYFQDDLQGASAYWEQGGTCSRDVYGWSFFEADKKPGEYNFLRQNIRHTSVNCGLNLHVSTFKDHTQNIVSKAALFDNVIGLQMVAKVIEMALYTTRSNGEERLLKDGTTAIQGQMELNGVAPFPGSPKKMGLKDTIEKEFARMKDSFYPKPKATSYPC
jgi:hypothetical protein